MFDDDQKQINDDVLEEPLESFLGENEAEDSHHFQIDRLTLIRKVLEHIEDDVERIKRLLEGAEEDSTLGENLREFLRDTKDGPFQGESDHGEVVEGIFDGQNMIGPEGKQYIVPANYASKSKLVEGDILKLTINSRGNFIFKQIGPIERRRLRGELARDEVTNEYFVSAERTKYKILTASVTYFKAEEGDEMVILVPKSGPSKWAAVENVIKE